MPHFGEAVAIRDWFDSGQLISKPCQPGEDISRPQMINAASQPRVHVAPCIGTKTMYFERLKTAYDTNDGLRSSPYPS